MKKRFSFVLALVLLITSLWTPPAQAKSISDFTDVKPGTWYFGAVQYAVSNELFCGTSATTFSPNTPMTRGMFITVLGRLHGVGTNYGRFDYDNFNDVYQGDYFYPYAVWARDNGIATGDFFYPNKPILREDMADFFYRYFQKFGYPLVERQSDYLTFTDCDRVSPGAEMGMQWAVRYGILNGTGQKKLEPQGQATRAQVAQIFLNFSKLKSYAASVPAPSPTPTPEPSPSIPPWHNYHPVYELPTGKSEKDAHGGYFDYDLANEIMKQINELRKKNGLNELRFHPLVRDWADIRAKECEVRFEHTRPNGSICLTVGEGLNVENAYKGLGYPAYFRDDTEKMAETIVDSWYNSIGHRRNMLHNEMDVAAISCYIVGNNVYAAHLFSKHPLYFFDYDVYDIYGWPQLQ